MSFYGKVFYELTNAFAQMIIKNSGYNDKSVSNPQNNTVSVPAVGLNSLFTIDTGNRWLGISAYPDDSSCVITHSKADNSANNSKSVLQAGVSAPTGATVTELQPEQLVKITSLKYDDAGHVNGGVVEEYFKMPKNDYNTDLNDLKDRMTKIEESDESQQVEIDGAVNTITTTINGLEGQFDDIEKSFTNVNDRIDKANKDIDDINDVIGNVTNLGDGETRSITELLGTVKQTSISKHQIDPTVASSIEYLYDEIEKTDNQVKTNNAGVNGALRELCNALKEYNINIDYDSLWE